MTKRPAGADTAPARLMAAAIDEFRRFGFARARLVSIAKAAGMAHANVYRYFASKEALADAVTSEWTRGIEAALADLATAPDPADDKLERMILGLSRAYRDRLEAEPELFAAFGEAVAKNRPAARRHRGRLRELFERVVEEGQTEGMIQRRDKLRVLTLLFDTCHRFVHPACLAEDAGLARAQFDARLSAVIDMAVQGLALGKSR
jgi:AcrR family transcriptional regulator